MHTVDTTFQTIPYTTEAQRVQVAQFAQASAVAAAGHFPDMNDTLSSQTSSYDTTALMARYNDKKAAAANDSSPCPVATTAASPSPVATTEASASKASVSSAHAMSQQAPDQASEQANSEQSPSTWTLSSFKDVVKKVENVTGNAKDAVSDAAGKLGDKIKSSTEKSPSGPAVQQASTASVSENIHSPHHTGSSASISATAGA